MNAKHTKKFVGVFCLFFISLYQIRKTYGQRGQLERVSYRASRPLSLKAHEALKKLSTKAAEKINPQAILSEAQHELPISNVSIKRVSPEHTHIFFEVDKPVALINNTHILTQGGLVTSKEYFEHEPPWKLSTAPCLSAAKKIASSISALPQAYAQMYHLHKQNEHTLVLKHCQLPLSIIILQEKRLQKQELELLSLIEQQIVCQKKTKKYKSCAWKADARFERMIVLSRIPGDDHEVSSLA